MPDTLILLIIESNISNYFYDFYYKSKINKYLDIRIHYKLRKQNGSITIRVKYLKLIIFRNQLMKVATIKLILWLTIFSFSILI